MIILKILIFSYTLLSAGRPFRKTSAIRTYRDEEMIPRKKFYLQDTTKTSIKTMEIFSLLNTDLGNWNDSSLIKRMILFPCIILFTSFQNLNAVLVCKNYKVNFMLKTKTFFLNKNLAGPSKRALGLVSKNLLKSVIPDVRPWL